VYGDRVFVTSQAQEGEEKSLLTLCFHRRTGEKLWFHDFGLGTNQRTHEKSNLAVNTPAVTKDAVYVAFGNSDIARYSHDGRLQWVTRYMELFGDPKMAWGYGTSPVVLHDSVVLPWDHHKGPCYLVGLDKRAGAVLWKKERAIGTNHGTPLLVEHHGQTDILVPERIASPHSTQRPGPSCGNMAKARGLSTARLLLVPFRATEQFSCSCGGKVSFTRFGSETTGSRPSWCG
jgi:hypothetical protein